ncbi:Cysteine proteinases superfamily protein, putative isoform 2 [Hibiscus syriacus]|uniref:Cysteine proteinases superfamily protein, putative isoform 2 n=1 Tax=Hibiscus syriacus TaxID=106335 RepID=A0A6A2XT63_HIBSY|nr:Cysteine proteinases superfamily protein, putative isoform 2 [Hibiscus syriacus]
MKDTHVWIKYFSFPVLRAKTPFFSRELASVTGNLLLPRAAKNSSFPNEILLVWAAGLTAAVLKKQSYLVNGLGSAVTDSKLQKEEPGMIEAVVLSTLEKFFASILNMPDVNQFVFNIYKAEGRPENRQTIYQIPLLVPKVPQQGNGKECGNFVLYFIKSFVESAAENFSIEDYPYFMKKDWFRAEEVERCCERPDSPACDFH